MNKETTSEIIELEETQKALSASELRYRRLFESAKDGILILDSETGQIVDVNPFLIKLLGYSYDKFVNKTIWDIGFFKDIIANQDNFLELKENNYIRYEDLPLETADGRRIDVEFVSNVYTENHHDVIQCNIRDITDRKRTADIIAAERERLAVTLSSIGDGVITTDTQGTIDILNKIAEKLCGWQQNEAQGKPFISVFNIIDENTRKPHEDLVEKVLATGKIIELGNNTLIISKDGTERNIANKAAPIKDKNNETIGVVLVLRDITEKQKLLETSQRNQKLESLGVLAGGIAHDFNNLMGGIFGYVDIAIFESKDSKVTQYLSKVMNTIDRARSLTQQLLTFAEGGAPSQKITPLFPFIQETVQFSLSGSNVSCLYDIEENLWPCSFDKNQIGQVIDNLIINAYQSMPLGGTIELTARNIFIGEKEHLTLAQGNYLKISIKDSGIGIPQKLLNRIFDPFLTTKVKGHGLGLATCYSIIKRHRGCIDVESELGEGSTFHIYLPASTDEVSLATKVLAAEHKGSGTILVMDDDEGIRGAIGDMLKSFGYTVVCKQNGKDAIDFFSAETKAMRAIMGLILDLTIPGGMGGKNIIKEIRKLDFKIPVFVISGYADDPVMRNPLEYGFTASICKPFRKIELAEMLDKYLGKH